MASIRCLQCPFVTGRVERVHRCPKNSTHCHRRIRRIINPEATPAWTHGPCTMSDEFDRLHRIEKAARESVLQHRSRVLAAKIANELRNKRPSDFVDEFSLADIYYSLEHVADVLSTEMVRRRS